MSTMMTTYTGQPIEVPSLVPVRDDTVDTDQSRDHAGAHAFSLTRLERLVADCDNQPNWRERSDLAVAFVDGKQFTPLQEAALISEGLSDVRPTNLVGRVVRSICGSEAKARTDIKVEADSDEDSDVCDVLNANMKEAQRETYADMAVSAAYFGQVAAGVGVVEVAENTDPLEYPDRVTELHRSEFWWDWKSTDIIGRDARWQCRKRWADLDELEAAMPQFRDLLRNVSNGWAGFPFDNLSEDNTRAASLTTAWEHENRWTNYKRRIDWYDSSRKRVKLYEVHYKVPAIGVIMHFGPNRRLLYDPRNRMHQQAVASGKVMVTKELTTQIRCSLYAGPHRLQDIGTTKRNFPYVPFFAYRDDEDLSPYGLVEGMISPQMEYNARRIRINWLLRARQLVLDNDALDTNANTLADIADRVNRPDLVAVLNANRSNKTSTAFQIGNTLELQKEQIDVMQDAKQLVQDVPGVYGSQLGQAASGVTSGIANSLLIEQGAVAMGDLNDNYRHSRRMVFELLLENQVNRLRNAELQVWIGRGSARRAVVLNHWDPEKQTIVNNVGDAPLRVGLGEVPSTPGFRMQQQNQIATIIGALASNPQAVAVLTPSFIESTDMPDRMERADDLRRASGIPTAGDRQAAAQMQKQQQEDQAKQKAVADAAMKLELEGKAADINETKSKTELNNAKTFQIGHGVGLGQAQAVAAINQPAANDPGAQKTRLIDEALAEAGGMPPPGAQPQPAQAGAA